TSTKNDPRTDRRPLHPRPRRPLRWQVPEHRRPRDALEDGGLPGSVQGPQREPRRLRDLPRQAPGRRRRPRPRGPQPGRCPRRRCPRRRRRRPQQRWPPLQGPQRQRRSLPRLPREAEGGGGGPARVCLRVVHVSVPPTRPLPRA
ncbi:hypothetical protein T484DRAFT_1896825, partial [Baffinella frigidus]